MPWKLNDLTLADGTTVPDANDRAQSLTLFIQCTAAERRQLEEMCQHKGRLERVALADGTERVIDLTGGLNTIYVDSGAADHITSGWYAIEDINTDWQSGPVKANVRLDLALIAGADNATGTTSAETHFLENDF